MLVTLRHIYLNSSEKAVIVLVRGKELVMPTKTIADCPIHRQIFKFNSNL